MGVTGLGTFEEDSNIALDDVTSLFNLSKYFESVARNCWSLSSIIFNFMLFSFDEDSLDIERGYKIEDSQR